MKRMMLAAVLLCMAGAAEAAELASLKWLARAWATETAGEWIEERWAPARGGVMMGTSLSGKGGKAASFEFLRLTEDGGGAVSLWAAPGGRPPVRFRLVSQTGTGAVFENPAHDFPTRIAYRRNRGRMTATISGPGGAGAQSWRYPAAVTG